MTAKKEEKEQPVTPQKKDSFTPLALCMVLLCVGLCGLFVTGQSYYEEITMPAAHKINIKPLSKLPKPAPQDTEIKFRKFYITAPGAERVELLADFNGFGKVPIVLDAYRKGYFDTSVALAAGDYRYVFLVDGKEVLDPTNSDTVEFEGRKVCLKTVR